MNAIEQALESAAIDILYIQEGSRLAKGFGFKRDRSLRSMVSKMDKVSTKRNRDGRDVSVKFDNDRNIVEATPGRLDVLKRYAADIEAGREISYDVNEDKLYRNQQAFASVMVETGMIEEDELTNED